MFKTAEDLEFLYYKCQRPDLILQSGFIKRSVYTDKNKGVSMTSYANMRSHGCFKLTFKNSDWFKDFYQVHYNRHKLTVQELDALIIEAQNIIENYGHLIKDDMFWNEFEYFSPKDVFFKPEDLVELTYLTNVANFYPRITKRIRGQFSTLSNYKETTVHDEFY